MLATATARLAAELYLLNKNKILSVNARVSRQGVRSAWARFSRPLRAGLAVASLALPGIRQRPGWVFCLGIHGLPWTAVVQWAGSLWACNESTSKTCSFNCQALQKFASAGFAR